MKTPPRNPTNGFSRNPPRHGHGPSGWITALLLIAVIGNMTGREIVEKEDRFEMTYRVTLPELTNQARIWLPLPKNDAFQTVEIEKFSIPTQWQLVQDRNNQNIILTLSAGPEQNGQPIEIKYQVLRREKAIYPAEEKDIARHLEPERLVPVNQTFKDIARKETRGKRSDMTKGHALYLHTLAKMKYDKSGSGWGRGDATYACDTHTGNCTDFHAYFIALCRAINIPARFAIGFTIPAEPNEGSLAGYHCWAEFFADGKWIPVDISEADRHPELTDYYFGHHPANRLEFSRGRDLEITPSPASGPINFLVYPLLEVDGKITSAQTEYSYRRLSVNADEAP